MRHRRPARMAFTATLAAALLIGPATAAFACGGLIAPNGTISLLRTTTLAAYHRGIEHYITSFSFAGKANAALGSIVPLPGVPTDVKPAGQWTLQRLVQETQPAVPDAEFFANADGALASARVLFETEIDALDITVLEGGADEVGRWATDHGFFLPPDAPEVLEFYAARSPIFLAARFNAARAAEQGVVEGEGTPIHVVIPTPNPWVPLRILALGRQPGDVIEADVYLLTDLEPALLPQAEEPTGELGQRGVVLERSEQASRLLLTDLADDRGMGWLPTSGMWFSHLTIDTPASKLGHDLAIDASGFGRPSPVAAGLRSPERAVAPVVSDQLLPLLVVFALGVAVMAAISTRRRPGAMAG